MTVLYVERGIHKARTTPFHPSSNGQVERYKNYNRTLMDAVRCFVSKHQQDWDIWLPQIAAALRASVSRSTGFTPNRLMLGREVCMPVNLVYGGPPDSGVTNDADGYLTSLEGLLKESHVLARETLKQSQHVKKKQYDLRVIQHKYKLHDLVYVLDSATIKGSSPKLAPPWKGPGIVKEVVTP